MALPTKIPESFRLYVTHVDGEGKFLRISGQLDRQASLTIESLFQTARENLENGVGVASRSSIREGIICAAKYKDGNYYRAKIINVSNLAICLIRVRFIDFGYKDVLSLHNIRLLDKYDPMFLQLREQATDYYLSRLINESGRWQQHVLMHVRSLVCNSEYSVTIDGLCTLPLLSIQFKGQDLSKHLVSIHVGNGIPIMAQVFRCMQAESKSHHAPTEHASHVLNQNLPASPASAMCLQQNIASLYNGKFPATLSLLNKRLLNNEVPRTSANLKEPLRNSPNTPGAVGHVPSTSTPATKTLQPGAKPTSPKKSLIYKFKPLEVNSQHEVRVTYAEEGPEVFAVHLVSEAKNLAIMMKNDINRRTYSRLVEPPMIGSACLGRLSANDTYNRAIVTKLSGSECALFFVDFGYTKIIPYYDIFKIPEEYVELNVLAMQICLSGVKKLNKSPHLNEAFKEITRGKVFKLKVVPPEGYPLIHYGHLYNMYNENVLDLLMKKMKDKQQFKLLRILATGAERSVLVSYVHNCVHFFIQLTEKIEELNSVMESVKVHCENSSSPGELAVGTPCCARYPDDGDWYRAVVRDKKRGKVIVEYVDYGNKQEVEVSDLRTITPELLRLPAVAMKCALKGFECKPVKTETSDQLIMLALEKTLICHVVDVLSSDTMLVTLVDDSVVPPLDIARKMNQLSEPRGEREVKPSTSIRKESGESFSSPEGSAGNEGHERSLKDELRPPDSDDQTPFQPSDTRCKKRQEREGTRSAAPPERDRNEFGRRSSGACGNETSQEPFEPRAKFTQVQRKEVRDPVPLETPFEDPVVELGAQREVYVTWIFSPERFYTQILSLQQKFSEMMHKIPELYKGVRPYADAVPVGASVLARYPVDGVLYRATVLEQRSSSKLLVHYVDFGNKHLVDATDIWQLDRQLMELPRMAVHCALLGVAPAHGKWKADAEIDPYFNAPRYQCVFQELAEEKYRVSLWNDGVSVADTLVRKQLAVAADDCSEVALKDEPIDMTFIVGQRILCRVTHVEQYDLFTVQVDVEENISTYGLTKLRTVPVEALALQCTLHHYSPESRHLLSLDQLKEKLTGNKFIVYVNDVDGITLVSTLYEVSTGAEVEIISPDLPLCARADFNYVFGRAYVSHAESLAEVYLQRASDGDRIALLLDDLYKFYEEGSPGLLGSFEAETKSACAAKSSDGNWYRGTVRSVDGDRVEVHFTDYGNSETVAKHSLRALDRRFHKPCSLATVASLGLMALREDALAKLLEWTTDQEVQMTLRCGTDGWRASLHLNGVDLAMKMLREELAAGAKAGARAKDGSEIPNSSVGVD